MDIRSKIILTVTTDLNYDQRMIRICTSLAGAGYEVEIVGIEFPHSDPLAPRPYRQTRLRIPMSRGKAMYLLYWWKLFWHLFRQKADVLCAIDLDTILPVYCISVLQKKKRVYDAHEIFTEMQEVNERPIIKKLWTWIGNFCIPRFKNGYTIGEAYAAFFREKYNVHYQVVRNATIYNDFTREESKEKYILYQGAVNKGRAFEQLIPAMTMVDAPLLIIGKGNFTEQTRELIRQYHLEGRVKMLGYIKPDDLKAYTLGAYIGITLFDTQNNGLSNKLSMANRYFDYMHSGVPQICCDYPEYRNVNKKWEVAYLIPDLNPGTIAEGINYLLQHPEAHERMSAHALEASRILCWQEEEKTLLHFYEHL